MLRSFFFLSPPPFSFLSFAALLIGSLVLPSPSTSGKSGFEASVVSWSAMSSRSAIAWLSTSRKSLFFWYSESLRTDSYFSLDSNWLIFVRILFRTSCSCSSVNCSILIFCPKRFAKFSFRLSAVLGFEMSFNLIALFLLCYIYLS